MVSKMKKSLVKWLAKILRVPVKSNISVIFFRLTTPRFVLYKGHRQGEDRLPHQEISLLPWFSYLLIESCSGLQKLDSVLRYCKIEKGGPKMGKIHKQYSPSFKAKVAWEALSVER